MSHTPGPWTVESASSMLGEGVWQDIFAGVHRVAAAVEPANARLIAAAPDLLEALEEIAKPSYTPGGVETLGQARGVARDAIAKAKGESSD